MSLSRETQDFLNSKVVIPSKEENNTRTGSQFSLTDEKPQRQIRKSETIDEMRERLEVRKLQIELDKLEKPDTSIDYYSKMLELQKEAFQSQLKMLEQQNALKLEIEKLKMGENATDSFGEEFLASLIPILPKLLEKKTTSEAPQSTKKKEVNQMLVGKPTKEQMDFIKAGIKSGEITEEQFFKDAVTAYPALADKKDLVLAEYKKIKEA